MDFSSWVNASGEQPHFLPRVEQSYIYEPQIPAPSTAPPDAWSAGQAGPSGVRTSPPSDFSMSMLLAPREPAVEERPITPTPVYRYRPEIDDYEMVNSSNESVDSMEDDNLSDDEEYQRYEKMALEELERRRGGPLLSSNPRMRREVGGAHNSTSSDDAANSTDAECSMSRSTSDADVTSSANVTNSADVNRSANASNHTSSPDGTSSANDSDHTSSPDRTSTANASDHTSSSDRTSSANASDHTSSPDGTSSANVSSSANVADGTYRRRRDRNNHAAKLSRDKRRLREMKLKIREAFLKKKLREDMQLLEELQHDRRYPLMRFEL